MGVKGGEGGGGEDEVIGFQFSNPYLYCVFTYHLKRQYAFRRSHDMKSKQKRITNVKFL